MSEDEEIISEGKTMIRHSGNVEVATIPSHIVKTNAVKRYLNRAVSLKLIRRNGRYLIEIKLEEKRD